MFKVIDDGWGKRTVDEKISQLKRWADQKYLVRVQGSEILIWRQIVWGKAILTLPVGNHRT